MLIVKINGKKMLHHLIMILRFAFGQSSSLLELGTDSTVHVLRKSIRSSSPPLIDVVISYYQASISIFICANFLPVSCMFEKASSVWLLTLAFVGMPY